MSVTPKTGPLMNTAEVALAFRANPGTVTRWAKTGMLATVRTPGGHRRYLRAEVNAHLSGKPLTPAQVEEAKRQIGGMA